MMSLQRNYYEVLGLSPQSSTDQIKKKYRELARKFHPDVVQDKALGQRVFTQINQAYSVLGDPERRAQYNDTLQYMAAQNKAGQNPGVQNAPSPSAASSPQAASAKTVTAPQPASVKPSANPQAFADMLARAENSIMAGKPVEARAFCVRILEADPRHIKAMDILGDALVQMGKPGEAAEQYRKALQVAPSSLIQAKLNRIAPQSASARATPPTRQVPPAAPARTVPPINNGNGTPVKNGNGTPPKNGNGTPPKNGNGSQKTLLPSAGNGADAEKPGGLLGRLLGRK
jgi:tetratricopeptide (TPR) repeat protein